MVPVAVLIVEVADVSFGPEFYPRLSGTCTQSLPRWFLRLLYLPRPRLPQRVKIPLAQTWVAMHENREPSPKTRLGGCDNGEDRDQSSHEGGGPRAVISEQNSTAAKLEQPAVVFSGSRGRALLD